MYNGITPSRRPLFSFSFSPPFLHITFCCVPVPSPAYVGARHYQPLSVRMIEGNKHTRHDVLLRPCLMLLPHVNAPSKYDNEDGCSLVLPRAMPYRIESCRVVDD